MRREVAVELAAFGAESEPHACPLVETPDALLGPFENTKTVAQILLAVGQLTVDRAFED